MRVRRRRVLIATGAAAGCAVFGALAQTAAPRKRLACLWIGKSAEFPQSRFGVEFFSRLQELGWKDGANVEVINRFAEEDPRRYEALAREIAAANPAVIHATFPQAVNAVRKAAPDTPIVFSIVADPVQDGFVKSLARPGGNLTGASTRELEFFPKRLQLLRELLPKARRIAVLVDVPGPQGRYPPTARALQGLVDMGRQSGIEVVSFDVASIDDVPALFKHLAAGRFDGLLVFVYVRLANERRDAFTQLVERARLPAVYGVTEYADRGGLMSFSQSIPELAQRAAGYVDKILRGARPAELPVEEPNVYEMVVNLKAAKAIGLTIPPSLLLRATRVIE